jgi:hypothetical protein
MKIIKLDKTADGFNEVRRTIRPVINGWCAAPDDHGLVAPLLVKEYASVDDAAADGCPPPIMRFAL